MADHAMILLKRVGQRQLMMTNERVVVDRPMIVRRRSIGIIGVTPVEISAVAINENTVRITFSVPVIDNAALRNPVNYETSPALTITAATPEVAINPTFVDLTTEEQTQGLNYDVTLFTMEAA